MAAMFFSQVAFALAACEPARAHSRAHMIAAQPAESAPCHQSSDNANLCLTHCQAGEQTLDKHQVKVPEASADAVLFVPALRDVVRSDQFVSRAPSPVAGPPPRILFRTLLI